MAKKNSYEKKAHQKQMLDGTARAHTEAKGNIGKSALAMGTDVVVGGVLGMVAGRLIGRSSIFVGMAFSSAGHYFGNQPTTAFGVGMMATGGYQAVGFSGPANLMDTLKTRWNTVKEDLKYKLFLDKIIKKKKPEDASQTEEGTNGMGEVTYFTYPEKQLGEKPLDFSALDKIEQQIENATIRHRQMNGVEGLEDEISGVEDYNF